MECCFIEQQCNYCPLYKEHSADCLDTVLKNAHTLITRQQVEIDRLNKEIQITKDAYTMLQTKIEIIKSEAVKQCLAKVKNYIKTHCNPYGKPDFDYDTSIKILNFIDNLLKEIVGDDNA